MNAPPSKIPLIGLIASRRSASHPCARATHGPWPLPGSHPNCPSSVVRPVCPPALGLRDLLRKDLVAPRFGLALGGTSPHACARVGCPCACRAPTRVSGAHARVGCPRTCRVPTHVSGAWRVQPDHQMTRRSLATRLSPTSRPCLAKVSLISRRSLATRLSSDSLATNPRASPERGPHADPQSPKATRDNSAGLRV